MILNSFLDPGHGGRDPGAVNGTRFESHDNLRMALAIRPHLHRQGFNVIMSRETDVFLALSDRTRQANAVRADLFVSIHRNGFHDPDAHGTEVVVSPNPTTQEMVIAAEILKELIDVGVQQNRGIKRKNFHVLRESRMSSVMPELGFITNTMDNELFDIYLDAYAQAIAKSVCSFFGAIYVEPNEITPVLPETLFRVQVGAFRIRENALNFLDTVRGMGLDAFIVETDIAKKEG